MIELITFSARQRHSAKLCTWLCDKRPPLLQKRIIKAANGRSFIGNFSWSSKNETWGSFLKVVSSSSSSCSIWTQLRLTNIISWTKIFSDSSELFSVELWLWASMSVLALLILAMILLSVQPESSTFAMKVLWRAQLLQLCLALCDLMDCLLPGSSVDGIFQARILECVSRGSSWPRD